MWQEYRTQNAKLGWFDLILFVCVGHTGFKAICLVPYGHISLWVSWVSLPFYRPTNSSCQILPVSMSNFLKCHPKGHSLTLGLDLLGDPTVGHWSTSGGDDFPCVCILSVETTSRWCIWMYLHSPPLVCFWWLHEKKNKGCWVIIFAPGGSDKDLTLPRVD